MIIEKKISKFNSNNGKRLEGMRLANQSDFSFVSKWLKEEFDKYGEGFWNNIAIIRSDFNQKQLFVYIHNKSAVGFITGPIVGPSILNVKKGYKRKGIGRKLFKYVLAEAKKNYVSVIEVECFPESSIKFWERMGFSIEKKYGKIFGYKVLEYKNKTVKKNPVDVSIDTYSEDVYGDRNIKPLSSDNLTAFLQNDGKVVFQKRLFLKKGELFKERDKDLVLSIKINGKEIFFDKAKRPEAEKIGIEKSEHDYGYYIDYLLATDILL